MATDEIERVQPAWLAEVFNFLIGYYDFERTIISSCYLETRLLYAHPNWQEALWAEFVAKRAVACAIFSSEGEILAKVSVVSASFCQFSDPPYGEDEESFELAELLDPALVARLASEKLYLVPL